LRSLGRSGVAALLDRLHANAVAMAQGLASINRLQVMNAVDYTQVMFCARSDDATRALGAAILEEGTAAVTGAEWRGRAALRCSMSSWATTADDVARTVSAIRRLVAA
jgi:glutamate/tyrosine decarboxylase-like PLP-dependent enzyme